MVTRPAKLSIVTTVYDRVDCLKACLASVRAMDFKDLEHIVVSDAPPVDTVTKIRKVTNLPGVTYLNLGSRTNNWGIGPAEAGLKIAKGKYVAFCSDDNGYLPDHFDNLIPHLDANPWLGFIYSSCLYNGERKLGCFPPRCGHVDLGQVLYRRELFKDHFGGGLPFNQYAWDAEIVDRLRAAGVRCRWVKKATFIFRLAKYPEYMPKKL